MRRLIVSLVLCFGLLAVGVVGPLGAVAQEATPVADQFPMTPDPAACTGEAAGVEELLGLWYDAEGTPVAIGGEATPEAGIGMMAVPVPIGEPADDATRAAVIETVSQVFACFAAGDVLRAYALFTDNLARQFGPEPGTTREDAEAFLTMEPQAEEGQGQIIAITDVMSLADGRVGAFVVDRSEGIDTTVYVMFSQEGDRLLIDDLIEFSPSDDEMDGN
jgi:hypothetical protein